VPAVSPNRRNVSAMGPESSWKNVLYFLKYIFKKVLGKNPPAAWPNWWHIVASPAQL